MNAQAEILTSFSSETPQGKVFVRKGETYNGTLTNEGLLVFNATNGAGKACEIRIEQDSELIDIKPFTYANTAKG